MPEVTTLKQWCTLLGEKAKETSYYENKLINFFKSMKVDVNTDLPFTSNCYKNVRFSKQLFKIFPKKLYLVLSIIIFIIQFILSVINKSKLSTYLNVDNLSIKQLFIVSGIFSIVWLILLCLLLISILYINYKSKIKQLTKLETNLYTLMVSIPMEYRLSDKMECISLIYMTKPTIDPELILHCVDEYFKQVAIKSPISSAIMFDLPCDCPYLHKGDKYENNGTQTIESPKHTNPYLPIDIDSKVYSGSDNSEIDLQNMIGLESVKDQITKFKNRISFYGKNSNNGCHMAFLGSAGTGKTTVARIVTKMLYDLGYIKNNQYIEISGDYLCAGDTNRALSIIEYSYNGVLFIDEAYLMSNSNTDIIGVLLKAMEDHRTDFVCILAGYEEQMNKLFALNEGFVSRIKHTIYFPDYTENEMIDIFNYFISNYNGNTYSIDSNAIPTLYNAFTTIKKSKSFGNARTVRNAVDTIMDYYADRCITQKQIDNHIILNEDILLYLDECKKTIQHEIKNTSALNQLDESIINISELKSKVKVGSTNPDFDLNQLIGLQSFKDEIISLKNEQEFFDKLTHQTILIVGNSGCGKSELTKILTGYLYQFGYIQENKYLEISAEFFKGSYVGHSAKRADAIISYAAGGVLYIKNYNLLFNDNTDSYAMEVINVIQNALRNNTDVSIIIGDYYSKNIQNIENLFNFKYFIPEYTKDDLYNILIQKFQEQQFSISDSTLQLMYTHINNTNLTIRDILQLVNRVIKTHIKNYDGNETTKYIIQDQDFIVSQNKPKIVLNLKN